jgi:hypothetical protein
LLFFAAKYQSSFDLVRSPSTGQRRFPKRHETLTLWQF